jgi:hypothetical protein
METGLVVITVLASLMAIGMGLVAWRTSAEEKRRGRARVAALTAAAGMTRGQDQVVDGASPLHGFRSESPADFEPVPHRDFLGSATTTAGSQHRGLLAAAVIFGLGLTAFGVVRMMGNEPTATAAPAATPLELLSLRHERQGPRLSVAGLVRNPESGAGVEQLNAVVLLFDEQGTFVTSARAPVEFAGLGAGDESPFVVSLDAPQNVARYRVSFRSDDRTMPHVDRRGDPAAAAPVSQAR